MQEFTGNYFIFYRKQILFAIFFAYLMMAGGTTPIEGVIASLGAGCTFALLIAMFRAVIEVAREMMAEQKQAKEELQQKE